MLAHPGGIATKSPHFTVGLKELDFVEGRNVAIEYRWADNQFDRLPELAADLIRRWALRSLPLPRRRGHDTRDQRLDDDHSDRLQHRCGPGPNGVWSRSLNEPGGNATGVADVAVGLGSKRLGLLHELLPGAMRFALACHSRHYHR